MMATPPLTAEQRLECLRLAVAAFAQRQAPGTGTSAEGIIAAAQQFESYVRGRPEAPGC